MKIRSGTLPVDSVMIPALAASPTLSRLARSSSLGEVGRLISARRSPTVTAEFTEILQHKQGVRNVINSRLRTMPIEATGSDGLAHRRTAPRCMAREHGLVHA